MKLIAENFVPVALNADRLPDNADGKFFRALLNQWPQGLWVVTPEGKVLGFHYHRAKAGESATDGRNRWLADTAAMLRAAAKEAGTLTARVVKVKPGTLADRGRGTSGEGGARLALSVIPLRSDRQGFHQDGPPVVDSIRLDKSAWEAFAPPAGAKVGTEWEVPEEVARRFTPALSPMTDPIFGPTPKDATQAAVTGSVVRIDANVIVVRYVGNWQTAHNRDSDPKYPIRTAARGNGVGVFEVKTGKPIAQVWLVGGAYQAGSTTEKPRQIAAVIEWYAERP